MRATPFLWPLEGLAQKAEACPAQVLLPHKGLSLQAGVCDLESLISQQRGLCWPGTLSLEDSLCPLPVPRSMAWPAVHPQVLLAVPAFLG